MKQITLTKSEKEIMNLLWNVDRPLTATEIVNMTPERTWKKSYIHLLINSQNQKELIKSDSLVRTGRKFGRTFVATMTEEEFEILVDNIQREGVLNNIEKKLILNTIEYGDLLVEDIMTKGRDVVYVTDNDNYDTIQEVFEKYNYN